MTAHQWFIDPAQYERHEQRRGRRHAFETLRPTRTALVVIDMVPFFHDTSPYTRGIVANVNLLASTMRSAGGVVAWAVPASAEPLPARVEFLYIEKSAPSAFFPGASTLDVELAGRGVDTVLIVGTVANVCVESSARDASTLGYRTVVVADAVSARCDDDLNATLQTIYRSFGDVRPTAEVVDLISSWT